MKFIVNHVSQPPSKWTGITVYAFSLLQSLLMNRQHSFLLLTTWTRENLPVELQRSRNLEVITLPYVKNDILSFVWQNTVLIREARRLSADALLNISPNGCVSVRLPVVTVVHDLYLHKISHLYKRRNVWVARLVMPLIVALSTRLIAVSHSTAQDLSRLFRRSASKTTVVHEASPIGRDAAKQCEDQVVDPDVVLFIGNVTPNKDVGTLVRGVALANERGKALRIVHVGRDDMKLLSDALRQVRLPVDVEQHTGCSQEEMAKLYGAAGACVISSIEEGFCLPVLEAQTLGTPLVLSGIPTLREVGGKGALYFPPGDAAALANVLGALREDFERRRSLQQAGKQNAERFSWERAAAETMEVLLLASRDTRTADDDCVAE